MCHIPYGPLAQLARAPDS